MRDKRDTSSHESKTTATPRQPEPGEVLRARPVKGPIDYTALIRECRQRYPKILATLADYERRCRERRPRG